MEPRGTPGGVSPRCRCRGCGPAGPARHPGPQHCRPVRRCALRRWIADAARAPVRDPRFRTRDSRPRAGPPRRRSCCRGRTARRRRDGGARPAQGRWSGCRCASRARNHRPPAWCAPCAARRRRGGRLDDAQVPAQPSAGRRKDLHLRQLRGVHVLDAPAGQVPGTEVAVPRIVPGGAARASHRLSAVVPPIEGNDRTIAEPERAPADVGAADGPTHPGRAPRPIRNPVPAVVRVSPPAVVERRPAPGLVREPRPSVRRPCPAAEGVRLPPHRDPRAPHVPDRRLPVPRPVLVQLVVIRRRVFRKVRRPLARLPHALLPVVRPHREVVRVPGVERHRTANGLALPGVHALSLTDADAALALEGRLALVDGDARLARVRVDPIHAAAARVDDTARGLDLEDEVAPAHLVDVEAARPQAEDHPVAGVVHVVELGAVVEAQQGAGVELELGPAALVGPDPVAGKEGDVRLRLLGAGLGRALDAHPVFDVPDAPVPIVVGHGNAG